MQLSSKNIRKPSPFFILIFLIIIFIIGSVITFYYQNKLQNSGSNSKNLTLSNYSFDHTVPDPSYGSVVAGSDILGYGVTFTSQKKLIDLLNSWSIFNKKYDLGKNGKNTGGVDRVVFNLTYNKQKNSLLNYKNGGESSVDMYAKDTQLDVEVYVSPKAMPSINGFFSSQALYMLYFSSHPYAASGFDKFKDDWFSFAKELNKKQPLLVVYRIENN